MRKKAVLISTLAVFSLVALVTYQSIKFYDGKLHIIFCNVGQGDGIFIRTPKGLDIIIDGGPDDSILACLSKHMPFWDRSINVVLLTHPHADHMAGFLQVFKKYKVSHFVTEKLENDTDIFRLVMDIVNNQKILKKFVVAGNRIKVPDGVVLNFVGPTAGFLQQTSPGGKIGERAEFASVETLVSYGKFKLLLTGDSQLAEIKEAIDDYNLGGIDVLQVPHHGSKTGLSNEILEAARPGLAIISVGKNKYGHPSTETIGILREKDIKILRTDENGDIEIVSDGKRWFVKGNN